MAPTRDDVTAFIDRLVKLTEQESTYEASESSLLFSRCSFTLLEQRGLALGGLGVAGINTGLGGKTLVELERPAAYHTDTIFPPHGFRPGDLAAIVEHSSSAGGKGAAGKGKGKKVATGKEGEGKDIEGVVYRVSDKRIVIALDSSEGTSKAEDELLLPERARILKLSNPSTFNRQIQTLEYLRRLVAPSDSTELASPSSLINILLGLSAPPVPPPPTTPLPLFDVALNDSQRSAIAFCAPPETTLALLHGPPGTGKTQTVVELIRQFVLVQDLTVLVCGASNLAVDNVLQRLLATSDMVAASPVLAGCKRKTIPLTRLGHPARVMGSLVDVTLDAQSLRTDSSELLKEIKVEMDGHMRDLGSGKLRGKERREKWGEVKELRKEYRRREGGVLKEVMGNARVVLATCHNAGSKQLLNRRFDVVIIDEAAQAVEPACWIPIVKGSKLILAGDHLQLPPTVKSLKEKVKAPIKKTAATAKAGTSKSDKGENAPAAGPSKLKPPGTLEETLFSRLLALHGNKIRRMLEVQYRMHRVIMDFPALTLYENKLTAHDSVKARLLKDLPDVTTCEETEEPVVFIDTAGQSMYERSGGDDGKSLDTDSKSNENEAALVQKHISTLVNAGVKPSSIAVISPYNSQVGLISSLLHPQYPEIEIGSVDGFQGREFDVVIVSLVRSNAEREVGFLKEKRRLNVAMTRPRMQLVVVGDSETVAKGSGYLKAWMAWLEENALYLTPDQLL